MNPVVLWRNHRQHEWRNITKKLKQVRKFKVSSMYKTIQHGFIYLMKTQGNSTTANQLKHLAQARWTLIREATKKTWKKFAHETINSFALHKSGLHGRQAKRKSMTDWKEKLKSLVSSLQQVQQQMVKEGTPREWCQNLCFWHYM